jgi:hypothetical protein
MSFFGGVRECNEQNGGAHPFGEPEPRRRVDGGTDYSQRCGGCGVTSWGSSPAEAMGPRP